LIILFIFAAGMAIHNSMLLIYLTKCYQQSLSVYLILYVYIQYYVIIVI